MIKSTKKPVEIQTNYAIIMNITEQKLITVTNSSTKINLRLLKHFSFLINIQNRKLNTNYEYTTSFLMHYSNSEIIISTIQKMKNNLN